MFSWKASWKNSVKICKRQKVYLSTFRLPSHLRLFGFSSSLSTLNGLSFVLVAADVQLERHPGEKKYQSKFKMCDFSTFRLPSHLSTFQLFSVPLDSQRFKFCTFSLRLFSWKGIRQKFKQSKSEKSKSILFPLFEVHT